MILTKAFLFENYLVNKKSISEIASVTGKDWATVRKYLILNGINPRSHKQQAALSSPGGKFKYSDLFTEKFFVNNYIKNKKSIKDIANETGIHWTIVKRYMQKLGVKSRSCHEQISISYPPKQFIMSKDCVSFLDGLLAGDGSIPFHINGSRSYSQACKHIEFLKYVKRRLLIFGITSSPILTMWVDDPRCKNGGYKQSILQTHRHLTFEVFRNRWYPLGKKIVPKDFKLTSDSLLQLYLSDGNFYREIRLCLSGFIIDDVILLKKSIEKEVKITPRVVSPPSTNGRADLAIKKSDTKNFLDYIGESPVKCYRYKWFDNESEEAKTRKNKRAREIYHFKRGLS